MGPGFRRETLFSNAMRCEECRGSGQAPTFRLIAGGNGIGCQRCGLVSYNRGADFGGWTDVHGCEDTRAVLLIRTSSAPVTFTQPSACTVKTGRWADPWSAVTTISVE